MKRGVKLADEVAEWGFKGENYLLAIGIDSYRYWPRLNNAVKDVRDITRLLTERYQFSDEHVVSLFDDEATEDTIREKLLEVRRTITPDDNLIVYFSGHGHYDPDLDEGYWVPANARKGSPSDYISNSDILKWIKSIKTHHTLVLVDSCFSGTLVSQSRSGILSEKYRSSRVFASGRKEVVGDGVAGTNSPFARAVLVALGRNTERALRASEVIQSVTKMVEADAGQAPVEGRLRDAGDEGGEFVFYLQMTESEIWVSVESVGTPEAYERYVDYFPDGEHVLEAKTKLSQLTDADDWRRAVDRKTPAALIEYLENHPQGAHHGEAFSMLEELEENEFWQGARTRGTASAFMDYLRRYPTGRFASAAHRQLDTIKGTLLQKDQDLVQDELEGIDDSISTLADSKSRYKAFIGAAERHFAQMQYAESIRKYEEALSVHEAHFVPDKRFVQHRIQKARAHIEYLELLDDGRKAMDDGNHTLALEFFRKARSIDDSVKVREFIRQAEQARHGKGVHSSAYASASVADRAKTMPQNKRGCNWMLWLFAFAGLFVLAVVIYVSIADREPGLYPLDIYQAEPIVTESLLVGNWQLTDRIANNISSAQWGTLIPAIMEIHSNGSLRYSTGGYTYSGTWQVQGTTMTIYTTATGTLSGYITSIHTDEFRWITTEVLTSGLTGQVTNVFRRYQ